MEEKPVYLRMIGDIHHEKKAYLNYAKEAEYSIQLGDFSMDDWQFMTQAGLDPTRHVFIGGNHDNYDNIDMSPHCLGDFGVYNIPEFGDIFFVRGGWSIDWRARHDHDRVRRGVLVKKNWWHEEELTMQQCEEALELYKQTKPEVVISHECPMNIVPFVSDPSVTRQFGYDQRVIRTRTNQLLQAMTEAHRPKLHVFGHYHKPFYLFVNAATFEIMDVEKCPEEERKNYTLYICVGALKAHDFPKGYLETL